LDFRDRSHQKNLSMGKWEWQIIDSLPHNSLPHNSLRTSLKVQFLIFRDVGLVYVREQRSNARTIEQILFKHSRLKIQREIKREVLILL
jgi:hypothetical protein